MSISYRLQLSTCTTVFSCRSAWQSDISLYPCSLCSFTPDAHLICSDRGSKLVYLHSFCFALIYGSIPARSILDGCPGLVDLSDRFMATLNLYGPNICLLLSWPSVGVKKNERGWRGLLRWPGALNLCVWGREGERGRFGYINQTPPYLHCFHTFPILGVGVQARSLSSLGFPPGLLADYHLQYVLVP